jgi:Sec-independent protein secretion pathway component TatC
MARRVVAVAMLLLYGLSILIAFVVKQGRTGSGGSPAADSGQAG